MRSGAVGRVGSVGADSNGTVGDDVLFLGSGAFGLTRMALSRVLATEDHCAARMVGGSRDAIALAVTAFAMLIFIDCLVAEKWIAICDLSLKGTY